MKTSLDLSDSLYKNARRLADSRNTSVRALIEEGLRIVLANAARRKSEPPKLVTFGGDGLTDSFHGGADSWDRMRDEIYRGHGS